MKRRAFVWLLVLAMLALGNVQFAAAQDGGLKAVTLGAVSVYEGPSDAGDPLIELVANTVVTVLGTDPSGAWLQIASSEGEGYVMADQVVVLTPMLLAPTVMVTSETAGAPIFSLPSMSADMVGSAEYGDTARLLGEDGQWTYVVTPDGHAGWSIGTAWETVEGLQPALIALGATDAAGLFTEPNITADLAGTLEQGQVIYTTGVTEGSFAEVMTADGATGWVDEGYVSTLPNTYVEATAGSQSNPALYAEADFGADVLTSLENGTTLTYLSSPDDFWLELYSPEFGTAYGQRSQFSPVFTTATVRAAGSNVRQGPDADIYNSIAQLGAGTEVVVLGTNEDGDWVKVLLPFSEIDYPYRGVEGWMAAFLFEDAAGESDLNLDVLSVVE